MDAADITTAADVERLTPDERARLFDERVVTDLDEVPADFLARARAKGRRLLEDRQVLDPQRP